MKRIAYVCGSESWGGLEMNQGRNALWMRERGHEVVVFGREGSRMEEFCLHSALPFQVIGKHKKYYDYSAARKLSGFFEKWNVNHIIIRDVRDMSVCGIAKSRLKNVKLHYFMEMQLGVKKTGLLHTIRFRQLDTWSCPLLWLKSQVETMTRLPHDRIIHIPSGLDLHSMKTAFSRQEARIEMSLPENLKLIGLAGRFDPQKGQLLLLEAMKVAENKSFGVVLLGEPTFNEAEHYSESVVKFIKDNDLGGRVFIRPFRKDISTFYTAIDAFVMASKAETFGMVTIEAMACGTPVIGSNAGGTVELLQSGKIGYLFEPMNAKDLAGKTDDFLSGATVFNSEMLKAEMQLFDHSKVCKLVEKRLNISPSVR